MSLQPRYGAFKPDTLTEQHRDYAQNVATVAHIQLQSELTSALQADPLRVIPTPGFHVKATPAHEVIYESMACPGGDAVLISLLHICRRAAANGDAEAIAWIEKQAKEHADFHCDDLATQMLEAGE